MNLIDLSGWTGCRNGVGDHVALDKDELAANGMPNVVIEVV